MLVVQAGGEGVPLREAVVELRKSDVLVAGSRQAAVKARQQPVDGSALRRSGGRAAGEPGLSIGIDHAGADDAAHQWKVAAREIAVHEKEQLILLDRAAQREAGLVPGLVGSKTRERVAGIERLVAEIPETAAVQVVGAALGNGVDHAAHHAAVLGGGVGGNHLELLHGILRDLRGDARASRVLVVVLLGGVVAVDQERVAGGHAAESQQAEGAVVGDGGLQQDE